MAGLLVVTMLLSGSRQNYVAVCQVWEPRDQRDTKWLKKLGMWLLSVSGSWREQSDRDAEVGPVRMSEVGGPIPNFQGMVS